MTKIGGWVALADMVPAWYLGFAIVASNDLASARFRGGQ